MAFRPFFSRDRLLAILALLLLAALSLLLARQMLAVRPVGPMTVIFLALLLPAAGLTLLMGYRVWQLFGLDYWLDRDALRIHWAGELITLPLGRIAAITPAPAHDATRNTQHVNRPRWRRWPLIWVRPMRLNCTLASYATQPPSGCLAVELNDCVYLISPRDPSAFLAAFRARRDFGAVRDLSEVVEISPLNEHWLWRDRLAQFLLVSSFVMGLALLSYFLWNYPTLPEQTPLHFDARGLVDRIGPRRSLLLLPSVTLLIWFFNVVMGFVSYERRPLATYLLWGNALAVPIAGVLIGRNLFQLMG